MVLYRNLALADIVSPSWSDAFSIDDAPGWWKSPWFGTFFMDNRKGWIMHEGLGWVFVFPQEDGIWMWHQEIGWIWTSAEVYPFLFRNRLMHGFFFIRMMVDRLFTIMETGYGLL